MVEGMVMIIVGKEKTIAENGLIPTDVWRTSQVSERPSPLSVMELAQRLEIHPAIVAGRVRHETKNFRLLSQFVGAGVVRRQLLEGPRL